MNPAREPQRGSAPEGATTDTSPGWPPPQDGRETFPFTIRIDEGLRIQGRQTLDQQGRLIDFSLEVQMLRGEWCKLARVDTTPHPGFHTVHTHEFDASGQKIMLAEQTWFSINGHQDVERGYLKGEGWLMDEVNLQRFERRWDSGH